MSNHLVKFITSEDEPEVELPKEFRVWCLVDPTAWDAPRNLCEGQVFGYGESEIQFEEKHTKRGGVTCPKCLQQIVAMKAVKL